MVSAPPPLAPSFPGAARTMDAPRARTPAPAPQRYRVQLRFVTEEQLFGAGPLSPPKPNSLLLELHPAAEAAATVTDGEVPGATCGEVAVPRAPWRGDAAPGGVRRGQCGVRTAGVSEQGAPPPDHPPAAAGGLSRESPELRLGCAPRRWEGQADAQSANLGDRSELRRQVALPCAFLSASGAGGWQWPGFHARACFLAPRPLRPGSPLGGRKWKIWGRSRKAWVQTTSILEFWFK